VIVLQNTLARLWHKYNLLSDFKLEMNKRGYVGKELSCLDVQLKLLKEIIEIESINVLSDLISKKTYLRLLKCIDRGIEYLNEIMSNSEEWVLNPIEKDIQAWIDKDVLVFSTKQGTFAFSKISRKNDGFTYVTQHCKWQ